jgi:hypothetical protein
MSPVRLTHNTFQRTEFHDEHQQYRADDRSPASDGSGQGRAERGTEWIMLVLYKAAQEIAEELINTWTAFGQFCRTRVGVEPQTMLNAWLLPIVGEIEQTLKRYSDVKADPAKVEEYAEMICKGWDRRFSKTW